MSRYYSYLNTTKEALEKYKGGEPLSIYLKQFFAARKQMGSRDRREVGSLVYWYCRLGNAMANAAFEEKIAIAIFLCTTEANGLLELLRKDLNEQVGLPLRQKIGLIGGGDVLGIFPFSNRLSEGIEKEKFCLSHLVQPDLFIRIRPKKHQSVKEKLRKAGIGFEELTDSCLAFDNKTQLESVIEIDREAVIQDYSSQQVASFLQPLIHVKKNWEAWDCCAASGGKSILVVDTLGELNLTVSDVRASIMQNLKQRFERAGIRDYKSFVSDLSKETKGLKNKLFDLIICDAPCSGSGTWGRVPENLVYFKEESINGFAELQKSIANNTMNHLAKGGYFLYITCSVFKKENEEVASFIQSSYPQLKLEKMGIIDGYKKRADNMFAALFYNPI